jgi:hypothetical protein
MKRRSKTAATYGSLPNPLVMDHEKPQRGKFMGLHEPFTILRNVRATTSSYLPELARNLQGDNKGAPETFCEAPAAISGRALHNTLRTRNSVTLPSALPELSRT